MESDILSSMRARREGFTLIELMIVVAIIGILAAIAIPKFASLLRKSREGATKGSLGAMRSVLSIYYGDMEGQYPSDDLSCLTVDGKYINAIPNMHASDYHDASNRVENNGTLGFAAIFMADQGHWGYWSSSTEAMFVPAGYAPRHWGDLWVGCVHTDTKGSFWTSY